MDNRLLVTVGWIANSVLGRRTFVRNVQAGELLENFFIAAVATVLLIRLYLFLAFRYLIQQAPITGRLAVDEIHIAHLLWGGILMLIGFILLLTFLNRSALGLAAIISGVGFGTFIDELGKYITRENNYFFQPAISLIYLTFIGLFLGIRALQRPHKLTEREALANTLAYAQQAVVRDFGPEDRRKALILLGQCDPHNPLVQALGETIQQMEVLAPDRRHWIDRVRAGLRHLYRGLVRRRWFAAAVVGLFVAQSVWGLYQTLIVVQVSGALIGLGVLGSFSTVLITVGIQTSWHPSVKVVRSWGVLLIAVVVGLGLIFDLQDAPQTLAGLVQLLASTVASVLVVFGIIVFPQSRLAAYRLFRQAVLVTIFVTQVFAFYEAQFVAVTGLFLHIIILLTLRFMIGQEETRRLANLAAVPKPVESRSS